MCQVNSLHVLIKDGSVNPMISAHLSGQIFANIEIGPYCFMDEEAFSEGGVPNVDKMCP